MWILVTLFGTINDSIEGVLQKKSTLHFNEYIITWSILVFSSIFYLPLFFKIKIPSELNSTFWFAVAARLIFDSSALLLSIKALKFSHLSLAVPMMSFKPVFLLFTSYFINRLFPQPLGLIGVIVIVIGAYFLNFDFNTKHMLSPFLNIKKEKGVQYMLAASFLWGFSIAFQKLGIDNSNAVFYTAFFQPVWAILFAPIALFSDKMTFINILKPVNLKKLLPIGILDGIKTIAENIAFTLTLPVYVTAVQSLGLLFSAFWGYFFFKEKISNKVIPIIIMVIGVVMITFSQNY